jgi:hypothetical protein
MVYTAEVRLWRKDCEIVKIDRLNAGQPEGRRIVDHAIEGVTLWQPFERPCRRIAIGYIDRHRVRDNACATPLLAPVQKIYVSTLRNPERHS